MLPKNWQNRIAIIDFAFQPIVNIHTGVVYGYEALLRDYDAAGFSGIYEIFDRAFQDDVLCQIDLALMEKAIIKFRLIEGYAGCKLFYNVDCRIWDARDFHPEAAHDLLLALGFPFEAFCLELTERHAVRSDEKMFDRLRFMKSRGIKIAVDDCGTGFNGLELMYKSEPDFIKIDRFFIQEMAKNVKKRLFVSSLVNISHLTGSIVIGEGVENKAEYYACREIGCDMIQGWLIAYPQKNVSCLLKNYIHIDQMSRLDRRKFKSADQKHIRSQMQSMEPLCITDNILNVFDRFKQKTASLIPIVNEAREPLGIIPETSFKTYVYSRYGRELIENPSFNRNIGRFIRKCPIADILTPVEKILEMYSQDDSVDGIIVVENMKYAGFLDTNSLLKAINEKNLALARDQNPLTSLPGNTIIHEYLSDVVENIRAAFVIAYFDIDYFKAYNDRFGFRNGDRVLRMFADMLRDQRNRLRSFVGHIGGDDFFLGLQTGRFSEAATEITSVVEQFRSNAESFYDQDTLKRGYIISSDRDGKEKQFPLLTVSAAILELEANRPADVSIGEIAELLAFHKKQAKQSPGKISIGRIFAGKGDPAPATLPDDGTGPGECHDQFKPVLSLLSSTDSSPSQLKEHLRACGIREVLPDPPGEDHAA